jgi:hypothetical protein
MDSIKNAKNANKFLCELCDFNTSNKTDYTRHLATDKHRRKVNDSNITQKNAKSYKCLCSKIYKYDSGYYKHKKICNIHNDALATVPNIKTDVAIETPQTSNLITPELVIELLKDNKEMKEILIQQTNTINELVKNGTNNTINSNNNNSNNKTFNLNFFLNETCKNAINMPDFINSIQVTFHDLIEMGELGYVGALTKVVTSKLKELGVTQRPIHCTDKKRDTLHIKENGKWEKDDDKIKMRKVIGNVSNKYVKLLPDYQKSHPDCHNSDSKTSDKYHKSVIAVMDGDHENKDKIINNISNVVTVEKKQYATAPDTAMID